MKKIFALIITFFYLTVNARFAFSELYYVKNISEETAKNVVKQNITNQGYIINQENPYYAKNSRDSQDYVVSVVQQSGNNLFYYYNSNNNKRINNNILKTFKSYGTTYEQTYNTSAISVYDNIAQKLISSSGGNNYNNNYTFYDEDQTVYLTPGTTVKSQQATVLRGSVVSIESGTKIKTYLQNPINTSSAQKGDRVVAVLTDDLRYNGVTVAPQGSVIYGTLTKARHATYGSRNGRVVIEFTQLVTPDNKTYEISTEKIDFTVTNDGKLSRTVGSAVAGAAVGALAGLLFGALGDYSLGTAAAIGAGVGAGTSLIGSGVERGVDAEIPSFTELEITLTRPFRVTVSY